MTATGDLIANAADRLAATGISSPRVDAEELAAFVIGVDRRRLALAPSMNMQEADRFRALVNRRAAREPLQHLTGRAPFRYVELCVGPGVFIPRPETELVAQAAIDEVHRLGKAPLVVDLGTGSGAIALAVATEVPAARVHAVEVDPVAQAYAKRNLAAQANVTVHLADATDALQEINGTVDVVVANPPYVPRASAARLDPEVVNHEPTIALFGGPDGLDGPRVMEVAARRLLRPGGLLVMEHDDSHGASAPALLRTTVGWTNVVDHRDLAGRPRYLTARRTIKASGRVVGASP
jgi:release factor glutamine methyltransferase